ncbi:MULTISPECIES: DUF4432 family protein [unclassified Ensifer]|uniref:DUF4432 family protein n=1 Tax=unclassified Ensifer TaxID=2633371 RepID=UPI0008135D3D|nr:MULTISPECIES: DUF4432 family protein [unclassified Ensifer]OCP17573.1 DUF4432 domain-containing protein [Ensifer sp. LC54]OCP28520.1 DUF4432 domain-containing protein [Ensifer sp. LC384]
MRTRYDAPDDAQENHILFDRSSALDIAAFVVDGVDFSPGTAIPSDGDQRIDRALAGFLFTCGPEHIRHPEPIAGGGEGARYPLHGSLAGTPVKHTHMSADSTLCIATVEINLADGGHALLERRWHVDADRHEVMLEDRLTNTGADAFPPMMMYHLNIAGRLVGDDTRITSRSFAEGERGWRFSEGESAHFCIPADVGADGWSEVTLSPLVGAGGKRLTVRFRADTLPYLQMWRCQRGTADVISIEPASHRLAKRPELAGAGELQLLEPGQTRTYALAFGVS